MATNVPVVVEMVMWSPWGCLWWSSGLAFCVSASSNRQEQEQEQRHTGHCHAPFPYHWRPSTPRTLPPDHSPPPIRTESMPRCRHIRDEVSSRQQAEGRRLAGGEEGRIGARDTFRHPPNRCAPTDPPSDRENGHLPAENGRPRTTYPAGQLHREQGLKDARIG